MSDKRSRRRIDAVLKHGKAAGYEHARVEFAPDGTVRIEFGPPPEREQKRNRAEELERKLKAACNVGP